MDPYGKTYQVRPDHLHIPLHNLDAEPGHMHPHPMHRHDVGLHLPEEPMFQQLGGPDVGCAVAAHFDEAGHDLDGGEGGGEGVGVCAEGLGCACSLVMLFRGGGEGGGGGGEVLGS